MFWNPHDEQISKLSLGNQFDQDLFEFYRLVPEFMLDDPSKSYQCYEEKCMKMTII